MDRSVLECAQPYITEYRRKKRRRIVVAFLAVAVAALTAYNLRTPAHTIEQQTFCGLEEHIAHDIKDGCYERRTVLCCGLPENGEHTHTEDCYTTQETLICEKPVHTHTLQCYSDPTADVENEAAMAQSVNGARLTGDWGEDVAAVAETQLGYCESEKNYFVAENGIVSGYTRYGDRGGSPYEDWGRLFCAFCCCYAGVDNEYLTDPGYCGDWLEILRENGLFAQVGCCLQRGDIVFLADETDAAGNVTTTNRAGIIKRVDRDETDGTVRLTVIEGNRGGKTDIFSLDSSSPEIMGYCPIPVNPEHRFTLSAQSEDGVTFTVSGSRAAFCYPVDCLSLSVTPVKDSGADELICNAVAGLGDSEVGYSVIENLLYDISVIYTDPVSGEQTEAEPCEAIELSLGGVNKNGEAEAVRLFHIDTENGTVDALSAEYSENGMLSALTDGFSVYGVTLLAAGGSTRLTALSQLSSGGSYYLSGNMTLSATVNISGGTSSVLDLNGYNITVACNPAFRVGGGTLTIKNSGASAAETDRTAGTEFGKTASYSGGTLTYYITETQITDDSTGATAETLVKYTANNGIIAGGNSGRAIEITNGGTVNFESGYICNFTNDNGGAVYISENNSKLNLTGGVLAANSSNRGGAVYLNGYSALNISGGAIAGNTASAEGGGGVYAVSYWQYAAIAISDGYITNNFASSNDYWNGGGGVQLERLATLTVTNNARITSNKASGGGGGVKTRQDWGNNESGRVEINGGFITANNATGAEGGGLNINAGGSMYMEAGHITNNIAGTGKNDATFQHWGGGGLFCSENSSSMVILNSLITDNSAGGFGGGVAGCSTGRIKTTSDAGTGIFDNEALGEHISGGESTKNEDHFYAAESEVFMSHGYQDYFCALASEVSGGMLGGGAARWEGSSDGVPVSSDNVNDVILGASVTGLTCNADETDKDAAKAAARSYFNGNESPTHGGGILANGYLVLGNTDKFEVFARLELTGLRKRLLTEQGTEIEQTPGSFEFVVADEYGEIAARAFNDESGGISLDRRLPFTSAGSFTYYLYEIEPENGGIQHDTSRYKIEVTVYADTSSGDKVPWTDIPLIRYKFSNVKVTETTSGTVLYNADPGNNDAHAISVSPLGGRSFDNRLITSYQSGEGGAPPAIYVSVTKKWNASQQTPSGVSVTLMENGTAKSTVTLNRGNNWKYTWSSGLSADAEYTVVETPVDGYIAEYAFTYEYDIVTVQGNGSNGALLYVLNGDKYVSATSLTLNRSYIIASPDGKKLLAISAGHADAALTSADTFSAVRNASDNTYNASDIPANCVFKCEEINRDGYVYKYLANQGVYSFLLAQNKDGTWLKTTNNNWYSSPVQTSNGQLQAQLCPDSWQSGNQWRYVIWDGSKFNSDAAVTRVTYERVTASRKNYTVTNTPAGSVEYTLAIKKCEKGNTARVLSGAVFELKNGNTPLRFTEISGGYYRYSANGDVTRLTTSTKGYIRISGMKAGTYTLTEVLPPYGYTAAADITVTLGADTPGRSLEIQAEDEKFVFILPQTGSSGTVYFYTFGVILCTGALMYGIRRRRKRKEVA